MKKKLQTPAWQIRNTLREAGKDVPRMCQGLLSAVVNRSTEATLQEAMLDAKTGWPGYSLKSTLRSLKEFWKRTPVDIWDQNGLVLYHSDGSSKVWRPKGTSQVQNGLLFSQSHLSALHVGLSSLTQMQSSEAKPKAKTRVDIHNYLFSIRSI